MHHRNSQSPTSLTERIAVAEQAIAQTKKRNIKNPAALISHYLDAAEALWPAINNPPTNPAQAAPAKHTTLANDLYTHATGQIARITQLYCSPQEQRAHVSIGGKTIEINTQAPHSFHPSFFDKIHPLDTHTYGQVGPYHHHRQGLGAALVGHREHNTVRLKKTPMMPPNGMDLPVNAIVDFPTPGHARLTLTNLLKTDTTRISGKTRVLAADFSAPVAAIASTQSGHLGLKIAISPEDYQIKTGLFALGPYDPNKIPLILTHGLISQPSTWTTVTNHLAADPVIRKNYQLLYYFYPTSYPTMISAANFRRDLLKFYKSHSGSNNAKLNRTVLIGHSMGGLLSSVQSRTSEEDLFNQLFEETPDEHDADSAYSQVKILFEHPTMHQIERTIFIATPHRGSELANNWIGKIGSSLIELPQSIMSLEVNKTSESMTNFGRSIINQGPSNSVTQLRANNPALKLMNQQPFSRHITYHSIIGNRGKKHPLEKSSDGVVPYWSSHLDGAASEKIVPANHEAHLHPQAHEEISRILHLHLQAKP